mgnify:CR=1 FL=1|tara:strand:+ start:2121 stop:2684 length:564 start_codon:yes stop_codon:yes gene_type:complete
MPSPKGDPTYIKNKDRFYLEICKLLAKASTHPMAPGGCVIVRDREIIGDGRSLLASCKVELDCISYAIATAAKRGTPLVGAILYSTRYPFSTAVFQCYLMGIRKIVILAHDWEPFYKDEFRRAARLARELAISIEPYHEDEDKRFTVNKQPEKNDEPEAWITCNSFEQDEFDPESAETIYDEDSTNF